VTIRLNTSRTQAFWDNSRRRGERHGVETPTTVTLRFGVQKAAAVAELCFWAPPRKVWDDGSFVTTAHGPDVFACARQAVRYMLDHLVERHDMTREQAYCLCGPAVDLRISQVVNEPNWIVSAHLPQAIFVSAAR
jgi:acetamidase/formamidase